MNQLDERQRFMFSDFAVRGEMVKLDEAYKDVLAQREYPLDIQLLLGQMMAAVTILSSTLKFEGSLILQLKSSGRAEMVMAECRNGKDLRAIARFDDSNTEATLMDGHLAITIEPDEGERYQGIVSITGTSLAESIQAYFAQSEQLETRIWLAAQDGRVGGLLLQKLPENPDLPGLPASDEDWNRVVILAETVTDEELLELPIESLLTRLYHEEQVKVFHSAAVRFFCSCTRDRSANAIKFLGYDDAIELLSETEKIDIDCQFCHEKYLFSLDDVKQIFAQETAPEGTVLH